MSSDRQDLLSAGYAAVLVALLVQIVGQLVIPLAPRRFTARTEVRRVADGPGERLPWPRFDYARTGVDVRLQSARGELSVDASRNAARDRSEVILVAIADTPEAATDAARDAAATFAARCQRDWVAARLQDKVTYDWRLQEARHYERKAWDALESFLRGHFVEVSLTAQVSQNSGSGESDTSVSQAAQPSHGVDVIAERRRALLEQRSLLEQQLTDMCAVRTSEHPEVQQAKRRLAEVESALADVERTWGSGADRRSESAFGETTKVDIERPVSTSVSDVTDASRYDILLSDYREAMEQRRSMEARRPGVGKRSASIATCFVGATQAGVPVRGNRSLWRHALILLTSVVAGAGMAWGVRSTKPLACLHNEWDVRRALGVSTLGQLSVPLRSADDVERLTRLRRWLAAAVHVAEWSLIALVVWCLVCAWRSSDFATSFKLDPWWTIVTAVMGTQ